jgi:hypothetical protein
MGIERLISNPKPLTLQEMIELLPESRTMGENVSNRQRLEVAIKTVQAIERFDTGSTRLEWMMVVMAAATLVLALVTALRG